MTQKISVITETEEKIETSLPAKVILFNDDYHTFEEVIAQIIKAIRCSREEAELITWEAHTKGRAIVITGELEECLRVSRVLEEIELRTQVEI